MKKYFLSLLPPMLLRLFWIGCFLIPLCLIPYPSLAQQSKADSLISLLKKDKADTNKVNHLNALGQQIMYSNPDTAILLGKQALALCENPKSLIPIPKSFLANTLGQLGAYHYLKADYPAALAHYFKALKIDEALNNKSGIAKRLGNIGIVYYYEGDYPKALDYYFKALKTFEELGNKNGIASILGNIGLVYKDQANYPKALDYYLKALKTFEELGDKNRIAKSLGNIGIVYEEQGDYPKALDYYLKALKMDEELGDKNGIARHLGNIGLVYGEEADYPKALDYYFKALKMAEELGYKQLQANTLGNIGIVYEEQGDYPKALDYYLKALKMDEELGDKNGIARHLGNIGTVYVEQGKSEKSKVKRDSLYNKSLDYYFKSLKIKEELGDKNGIAIHFSNIGSVYTKTGKFKEAEEYLKKASAIFDNIGAKNDLRQDEESLSQLYDTLGQISEKRNYTNNTKNKQLTTNYYQLALIHYKKAMVLKDTIFSQESKKQLVRKEMNYEFEKKEAAAKAEQDKKDAIAAEEARKQKIIIWSVLSGLLLVVVFAGFIFRERRKSEKLLLNILPAETANELKANGKAKAKYYESVTVMFTDFKNFTQIAEQLSADELVSQLDFLFKKFDEIISKYQIEKIKTIGDSYMCASGLPTPNSNHAENIVLAALEIQHVCSVTQSPLLMGGSGGGPRIGIHSGPVTAGVVGDKKFAYDIWGDTVNTASRMESSGEAGKVNISGSTFSKLQTLKSLTGFQTLSELKFIYRGKIPAKHKGEVEMYFVEQKII